MIIDRLGSPAAGVMQLPIGAESEYKGVIDLLKMKAIVWKDEALGAEVEYTLIFPPILQGSGCGIPLDPDRDRG